MAAPLALTKLDLDAPLADATYAESLALEMNSQFTSAHSGLVFSIRQLLHHCSFGSAQQTTGFPSYKLIASKNK